MWKDYIQKTKDKEPGSLLKEAVAFARLGNALDLGAGALNESRYLQSLGYDVTAVDSEPSASAPDVNVVITDFNSYEFPKGAFALVNARYSLPFNGPGFEQMFSRLKDSLADGGIFTGHFFGVEDEWNGTAPNILFHTADEVRTLLEGLEILKLDEEKGERETTCAGKKFAHLFSVIARKP
jgi:SAM-dependent methyltransferase